MKKMIFITLGLMLIAAGALTDWPPICDGYAKDVNNNNLQEGWTVGIYEHPGYTDVTDTAGYFALGGIGLSSGQYYLVATKSGCNTQYSINKYTLSSGGDSHLGNVNFSAQAPRE